MEELLGESTETLVASTPRIKEADDTRALKLKASAAAAAVIGVVAVSAYMLLRRK